MPVAQSSWIGSIVDRRYRVERRLGAGGMAEVFEAVHTTSRRRVALKRIALESIQSADRDVYLSRFEREARAAAAISSPHIAQVLDAGRDGDDGAPYLAMELLEGEDLRSLLQRVGVVEPRTALSIALEVSQGLEAAHAAGIIHRDIKPANLFLHRTPKAITVKLVDFGVAKLTSEPLVDPETAELTRTGTMLGTPHYMSPEQVLQTRMVDPRSDIWSLGVVLYKLLTGENPFDSAASMGLVVLAICAEPIPSVRARAPWVDPEIEALVRRMLQRDLDARIGSANELSAELTALLERDGPIRPLSEADLAPLPAELVGTRPARVRAPSHAMLPDPEGATAPTQLDTPAPKRERSSRPVWAAGLGLVLVATAFVALRPPARGAPLQRALVSVTPKPTRAEPKPVDPAPTTAAVTPSAAAPKPSQQRVAAPAKPASSTPAAAPASSNIGLRGQFE